MVVDRQFSEPHLAALYDPLCGREERADFRFYLPLVMAAEAVLDVGCGTGALLHWTRESGHAGRLVGLDPARGMVQVARTRSDIEWILGDLSAASWHREFDLAVMTGHAFQVLVSDHEIRTALATIYTALAPGGVFVFETRNPLVREWERWTPEHGVEFSDRDGTVVQFETEVETPVIGDVVRFTNSYRRADWERAERSPSTLRFLAADALASFLSAAGFVIEAQYGDWDRSPVATASSEIITIARISCISCISCTSD